MNMEDLLSVRKEEASARFKEYTQSKISSHPSSRIVITLNAKGNQLFSFVTLCCTLADFHLYRSHQIWMGQRQKRKEKEKQTNKTPQCFRYGLLGVFLSHKKLQH